MYKNILIYITISAESIAGMIIHAIGCKLKFRCVLISVTFFVYIIRNLFCFRYVKIFLGWCRRVAAVVFSCSLMMSDPQQKKLK